MELCVAKLADSLMVRPSHYLVLFTIVFLIVAWELTGGGWGSGPTTRGSGERELRTWSPQTFHTEVVGKVLDRFGWPVPDASVRVGDEAEARTDSEGWFRVPVIGPLAVDLEVTAPDHAVVWERVQPASGEQLVLVLGDAVPWQSPTGSKPRPEATKLWGEGFLRTADGTPIAGAVVTVRETGARARSDEVGRYEVALPHETAFLVAHAADGLLGETESHNPPARQGLTPIPPMTMVPGAGVQGLLRSPDGEPMVGAALILEGEGARRRTEAGADGLFRIRGLLGGNYVLTALPFRGFLGFQLPVYLLGNDVDLQDLALLPQVPLRIQVVGEAGEPWSMAHVLVEESGLRRAHAQADEFGWVSLLGLVGDSLRFEVRTAVDFRSLLVLRRNGDQLIVAED
jgi:hypothetical protein